MWVSVAPQDAAWPQRSGCGPDRWGCISADLSDLQGQSLPQHDHLHWCAPLAASCVSGIPCSLPWAQAYPEHHRIIPLDLLQCCVLVSSEIAASKLPCNSVFSHLWPMLPAFLKPTSIVLDCCRHNWVLPGGLSELSSASGCCCRWRARRHRLGSAHGIVFAGSPLLSNPHLRLQEFLQLARGGLCHKLGRLSDLVPCPPAIRWFLASGLGEHWYGYVPSSQPVLVASSDRCNPRHGSL